MQSFRSGVGGQGPIGLVLRVPCQVNRTVVVLEGSIID